LKVRTRKQSAGTTLRWKSPAATSTK
jgi:hypothetical protein